MPSSEEATISPFHKGVKLSSVVMVPITVPTIPRMFRSEMNAWCDVGVSALCPAPHLVGRPYKVIGATEAIEHNDASLWTPQPAILEAARARDVKEATRLTKQSLASARQRLEKRLVTR